MLLYKVLQLNSLNSNKLALSPRKRKGRNRLLWNVANLANKLSWNVANVANKLSWNSSVRKLDISLNHDVILFYVFLFFQSFLNKFIIFLLSIIFQKPFNKYFDLNFIKFLLQTLKWMAGKMSYEKWKYFVFCFVSRGFQQTSRGVQGHQQILL